MQYVDTLNKMIQNANSTYRYFLKSEEGFGFNGNVCLIGTKSQTFCIPSQGSLDAFVFLKLGDCMGAILAYDALCHSKREREDFFTLFFRGKC